MNKFRLWLIPVVLGLLILPVVIAQTGKSKEDKIRELMELTGASKIGVQVRDQMIAAFTQQDSTIPPGLVEEMRAGLNPDSLTNLIIPIYAKYFTDADIDGMNQFYQTETGKKMIQVMPALMRELQTTGGEWGRRVAQQATANYRASHPGK